MKSAILGLALFSLSVAVCAQTPPAEPQPANFANYSIMLLPPQAKGAGVVLMHNPQNALEYVEISKIKESMDAGYVPVRLAEIAGVIASLQQQVSQLKTENATLQSADQQKKPNLLVLQPQPIQQPSQPSPEQIEAEQRARSQELLAQAAALREERRERAIQTFMLMQNMNRQQYVPPTVNPIVNPNAGRLRANCTAQQSGTFTYTNCN